MFVCVGESIWTQKSDGGKVALALHTDLPQEVSSTSFNHKYIALRLFNLK